MKLRQVKLTQLFFALMQTVNASVPVCVLMCIVYKCLKQLSQSLTSIPWAVKLSWLFRQVILTHKVGQTDLVFGARSGFISRSVHVRSQVSVCNSYDLCHTG